MSLLIGELSQRVRQYIDAGGNLLMSGASIAFDWDHTDFLENIAHADYLTAVEQADFEGIDFAFEGEDPHFG